jgi:hypothetical protein
MRDCLRPYRLCGEDIILHDRSKYPSHSVGNKKIHRLSVPHLQKASKNLKKQIFIDKNNNGDTVCQEERMKGFAEEAGTGKIKDFWQILMMVWQKVVSPVKAGVQCFYNYPKLLDSGFRRNDDP